MLKLVKEFYISLGYEPLPASFWQNSMVTKSGNSSVEVCFPPRAWNFWKQNDYRYPCCALFVVCFLSSLSSSVVVAAGGVVVIVVVVVIVIGYFTFKSPVFY